MAAIQCGKNEKIARQLSSEEKANLDKIIKQAECSSEYQKLLNQSQEGVVGAFQNLTNGSLTLMSSEVSGAILKPFPNPLVRSDGFLFLAVPGQGIKANALYSGTNKSGNGCGWRLSFEESGTGGYEISAACGSIDKFKNINLAQDGKYGAAGGAFAVAYDEDTGTSLYATIAGSDGNAVVGAVFAG